MAEATHALRPTWPDPSALLDLIDDLRAAGYNLDLTHYMAAQDLLLALAARGETLDQPQRLKGVLGPLLCSSPAEQAEFSHHFDRWAARLPRPADPIPVAMPTGALEAELVAIDRQVRWGRRLLMGIYILLLSSLLQTTHPPMPGMATIANVPFNPVAPTAVADNTSVTPLPEQIGPVTQPPSMFERMMRGLWRWQTLAAILLLLMPWLAWRLWWFYQAHLFLVRHATTQTPALEQIVVQSSATTLIAPLALFRLAQGLRRRVEIPSYELDIEGALNATIQQAGWFTPVYGRRRVVPEYLILVDRAHYQDHQARLVEELVQRLRAYEVLITLYAFDGDPRICFPLVGKGTPLTLRDLTTRHPDQRLILFADAQSLFSPFTGDLEPWVAQLARWPERALLTPEVAAHWGYHEQELAEHFSVLPATPAGLAQLVQSFTQPALFMAADDMPQARLPDALRTRPLRWLERQPPEPAVMETLLAELRTYLDEAAFTWLCACAVYPTIDWNLTLYLGHALQTDEQAAYLEPNRLLALSRLPWLRYGYMPDWLRGQLLKSLPRPQERDIRFALQVLLVSAVQGTLVGFPLEIARKNRRGIRALAKPVLRLLLRKADEESPLHNYVFLHFMTGRKSPALALQVPLSLFNLFIRQRYQALHKYLKQIYSYLTLNLTLPSGFRQFPIKSRNFISFVAQWIAKVPGRDLLATINRTISKGIISQEWITVSEATIREELVKILIPHMTSSQERQANLHLALPNAAYRRIDFQGSAHLFTVNLVNTLLQYGEIAPGKQALVAVLEVIHAQVGADTQYKIAHVRSLLLKYFLQVLCEYCHTSNRPKAKFCRSCGKELPATPTPQSAQTGQLRRVWPVSPPILIRIIIPLVIAGAIWGIGPLFQRTSVTPPITTAQIATGSTSPAVATSLLRPSPSAAEAMTPVDGSYHTQLNAREAYLKATDICVQTGDVVAIKAEGEIEVGTYAGDGGKVGPEGTERGLLGLPIGDNYDLVPAFPHAVLMFRIVGETAWRSYADPTARTFTVPATGCLEFQLNDNDPGNNSDTGFLNITVSITPAMAITTQTPQSTDTPPSTTTPTATPAPDFYQMIIDFRRAERAALQTLDPNVLAQVPVFAYGEALNAINQQVETLRAAGQYEVFIVEDIQIEQIMPGSVVGVLVNERHSRQTFERVAGGDRLLDQTVDNASVVYGFIEDRGRWKIDKVSVNTIAAQPMPTLTKPSRGVLRLVFVYGDIGDNDLRVANVETGAVHTIAGQACDEAEPAWSPGGTQLVYQADCAESYDIYRVNSDGSVSTRLTFTPDIDEREPVYAPDGSQIIYRINLREATETNAVGELWIMDSNGNNQRGLGVIGRAPAWSPDGSRLAFMSDRSGRWNIYLYEVGTGRTDQLTNCNTNCRWPAWSPDGQQLVYNTTTKATNSEAEAIWIMPANGGNATRITTGRNPGRPSWSNTGLIVFNSADGIEYMRENGSERTLLIQDKLNWVPHWSQ